MARASSAASAFRDAKSLLKLRPEQIRDAKGQLERFEKFTAMVTTKDGDPFVLEWWQRLVLIAYFAGLAEILILIPKGAGKTTLLASLAVYHLLTTNFPQVYIGASTKDQAKVMYAETRRISQLHPQWRKRLIPRPSTKEIYVGRGAADGSLAVLASDRLASDAKEEGRGSLEGIEPTLGLVDELQAHVNDAIYAAIQGALHKRDGQLLGISTAGTLSDSLLKRMRDEARKFRGVIKRDRLTVARRGQSVMLEWALEDRDDPEDMAVVKRANPSSFVTQKALGDLRRSFAMTPTRWRRRHCNIWVESEDAWIEPGFYDACEEPSGIELPHDEPIVLGYDHARSYDRAALIAVRATDTAGSFVSIEDYDPEEHEGGRGQVLPLRIFHPEDEDGGRVPYWRIKREIREACELYTVAAVGFDKLGGFAQSAEELDDEGLPMVEVSMRGNVWAPLTAELYAAIKGGRLRHPAHAELRSAVLAGETKDSEWGERLHGKPKSGKKVDALMATGIAWFTAFFTPALNQSSVYEERDMVVLS